MKLTWEGEKVTHFFLCTRVSYNAEDEVEEKTLMLEKRRMNNFRLRETPCQHDAYSSLTDGNYKNDDGW